MTPRHTPTHPTAILTPIPTPLRTSPPTLSSYSEEFAPLISSQPPMTTDKHSDPRIRDKKALPFADLSEALPTFLATLFILTPIWIGILLPLTLVSQIVVYVLNLVLPKSGDSPKKTPMEDPEVLIKQIKKKASDVDGRIYDVVVFGATGFTGKMAAVYLAKQYKDTNVRWAIAGRRLDALKAIQKELAQYDKKCATVPIILADSFDEKSLEDMCIQTKVVITTAGPFDKYGSALVKSCVACGTHYCDITGETDWVRKMIDQYDNVARVSGSRIVHFCGHDCVPWDLVTLECSKALQKRGEALKEISFYDEVNSGPSGGTLATVFHVLSNRTRVKTLLGFDPLLKTLSGEKSALKFVTELPMFIGYSSEHKCFTTPFAMAMVMANCVRRSHTLNSYSAKMTYKEAATQPSLFAAYITFVGFAVLGTALFCPPLQWALRKFVLPEPGQGPSEKSMDAGYLHITGYASGDKGSKVKSVFYFPTDPGYRDTARMLVESGLVLALEMDRVKVGGGVFTPAACQGEALRERLVSTGSSFFLE